MLAYLQSPAFLAMALAAIVGADARPQALLALAPNAVMLAYLRSPAFLARDQHVLFSRLWGQMLDPRNSLHQCLGYACICSMPHMFLRCPIRSTPCTGGHGRIRAKAFLQEIPEISSESCAFLVCS
jgi:hypothetical protein